MNKKNNWQEFKAVLDEHRITKLYHFTDRDNLESIIKNGGLYSWGDCEDKGIKIQINFQDSWGYIWRGKEAWPKDAKFIDYLNKRLND